MPSSNSTGCDGLLQWSSDQARSLLEPLGTRWLHVQGVVERAYQVSQILSEDERPSLIAAAYLHDVGYAPSLRKTGFHPLDGAFYLRSLGQERLASLIAYHSESQYEAQLRGLLSALERFPREHSLLADALTYCDLTTNATGKQVPFEDRVADILHRYDETDIVVQALHQAMPAWRRAIVRVQSRLKGRS
jgi:HD domain